MHTVFQAFQSLDPMRWAPSPMKGSETGRRGYATRPRSYGDYTTGLGFSYVYFDDQTENICFFPTAQETFLQK